MTKSSDKIKRKSFTIDSSMGIYYIHICYNLDEISMSKKDMSKKQLTKEWITIMLHQQNQSQSELIDIGCKVMVLGHEYEEFLSILDEMIDEKSIERNASIASFMLTDKGKFNLRKYIFLPFTTLLDDKSLRKEFVVYSKGKCDAFYLENFDSVDENEQIEKIKNYSRKNYEAISKILYHAIPFIANYVDSGIHRIQS